MSGFVGLSVISVVGPVGVVRVVGVVWASGVVGVTVAPGVAGFIRILGIVLLIFRSRHTGLSGVTSGRSSPIA